MIMWYNQVIATTQTPATVVSGPGARTNLYRRSVMSDHTTPTKRCNDCGNEFPATTEFWHRNRASRDGLCNACKACYTARSRRSYASHLERRRAINRGKANRFRARNPERARELQRQSERKNPQKYTAIKVRWQRNNPDKVKATNQKRLAKAKSLPARFTADDWRSCLIWWHGQCAYCGITGNPDNPITADHFIPLNDPDCPGTVPENLVPACRKCNGSKQDRDPVEWLTERTDEAERLEILGRIAAYFDLITARLIPGLLPGRQRGSSLRVGGRF